MILQNENIKNKRRPYLGKPRYGRLAFGFSKQITGAYAIGISSFSKILGGGGVELFLIVFLSTVLVKY